MGAEEFLGEFADLGDYEIHVLRDQPSRLDSQPSHSSYYLSLVNELFPLPPTEEVHSRGIPALRHRHRLMCLLIEFLYHDGRSFDALLSVAEPK